MKVEQPFASIWIILDSYLECDTIYHVLACADARQIAKASGYDEKDIERILSVIHSDLGDLL